MAYTFLSACGFPDEYAVAGSYEKLDVIESAVGALREGVGDRRTITTMLAYTHTSFYEFLDNVKERLAKLCSQVLSALNNYYINNVKLFQKYQEIIKKGLARCPDRIIHESYEFPLNKGYPRPMSSGIAERDIIAIHNKLSDPSYAGAKSDVDRLLAKFSKQALGAPADVLRLKDSTHEIVDKVLRGPKITFVITPDTIDEVFSSISDYHKDRDVIKQTEKTITDDYEALKRTYKKVTEDPVKLIGEDRSLKRLYDPDKEDFISREYNRYADIHVEMMRLFNGYLTIYGEAFKTKLRILDDKYADYRNLLIEIFTKTGAMAAITRSSKMTPGPTVIAYNPKMGGYKG